MDSKKGNQEEFATHYENDKLTPSEKAIGRIKKRMEEENERRKGCPVCKSDLVAETENVNSTTVRIIVNCSKCGLQIDSFEFVHTSQ